MAMKLLRVLTAISLVGVAVVHLRLAEDYTGLGTRPFSLGDQFYAQAAGGIVLALALLVRPHRLVWLASAGFAALSVAALVYSRYRALPIPGVDGGYQESWSASGAKPALAFELAALLLAAVGLLRTSLITRTPARDTASVS